MNIKHSRTLPTAFIIFLSLIFTAECVARIPFARQWLEAPDLGSRHRQFEIQVGRLDRILDKEGSIDCIFLGSSLVWLGVKPDVVMQAVKAATGETLSCFNFGISALPASGAGVLAQILVRDYHPKFLIYGTSARDYAIPREAEDASVILDSPWIQFRTGHPSVQGWLYNYSYFYRYKESLHGLLRFDKRVIHAASDRSLGFLAKTRPIKKANIAVAERNMHKWLYDYKVLPENLMGLRQVVKQRDHGVHVIVIDMPLKSSYFGFFKNGKQDFNKYLGSVGRILASSHTTFWMASDLSLIPDDGWWDYSHLNLQGAKLFSAWLGHKMSQEVVRSHL